MSRNTLLQYLQLLERAELISTMRAASKGISALQKPDKIYLNNPNLLYALAPQKVDIGTLRETFFFNQLSELTNEGAFPPKLELPKKGDFAYTALNEQYLFEIGGPNKEAKQIGVEDDHFVVIDATLSGHEKRIPLWMFGLLY